MAAVGEARPRASRGSEHGRRLWRLLPLLLAASAQSDGAAEGAAAAEERRLAPVTRTLPASGIALRLTVDGVTTQASPPGSVSTFAGRPVSSVEVVLTGPDTWAADLPRLKFVRGAVTDASAAAGACAAAATGQRALQVPKSPFARHPLVSVPSLCLEGLCIGNPELTALGPKNKY